MRGTAVVTIVGLVLAAWGDWLEIGIGETVQFIRVKIIDSLSWVSWLEVEVIPAG